MRSAKRSLAFTLLELMMSIVILCILAVLLFPAMNGIQAKIERIRCIGNLKGLYTGAALYVQQNGHWPQIDPGMHYRDSKGYAKAWITALQPMGIDPKNWICPTLQRSRGGPDFTQEANIRIDYIPMPFDDKEATPFRWPSQPWFAENSSVHGTGNLIIFTDGSVRDLNDVKKSPPRSSR